MVNGTKQLETVSQSTHIADRRVGFNHCASRKMRELAGQAQKKTKESPEKGQNSRETTNKTCPPKSQMSLNLSKTKHIKEQETTQRKNKS